MDMCAAPGVKTSHIAGCLQNEGLVVKMIEFDLNLKTFSVKDDFCIRQKFRKVSRHARYFAEKWSYVR